MADEHEWEACARPTTIAGLHGCGLQSGFSKENGVLGIFFSPPAARCGEPAARIHCILPHWPAAPRSAGEKTGPLKSLPMVRPPVGVRASTWRGFNFAGRVGPVCGASYVSYVAV